MPARLMMADRDKPAELVDQFAIVLATVRGVLLNPSAKPVLLGTYDSMTTEILATLHTMGFSAEELMAFERALARLRLALDEQQ
jgi:hypothetical protein